MAAGRPEDSLTLFASTTSHRANISKGCDFQNEITGWSDPVFLCLFRVLERPFGTPWSCLASMNPSEFRMFIEHSGRSNPATSTKDT